jgi:hypothetical protein
MPMQKTGATVTPIRIKQPETDITRLKRMKDELEYMIQRCQSLLFTAAETPPDEAELDAMQDRVDELRAELETTVGE